MKIAYIVRKYQTSGGTERFTFNISNALANMGHEITIFCNKKKIEPPSENIKIVKLPQIPINRTIKTWWFYKVCNIKINLNEFDIVQGSGKVVKHDIYRAGGGFHKLYLKMINKKTLNFYDKVIMGIEKKIFNVNYTRYIISVSNFLKNEIHKEFGYPLEKIEVFYSPVDLSIFNTLNKEFFQKKISEKFNIPKNFTKFLFVSNNFKLKGLENILKAIQDIEKCVLFVVGGDNFENFIKNFKKDILEKVFFLGEKRGQELIEIYKGSDFLLHPAYFDNYPNVCLEAMATGLPVIVTKTTGTHEIIDNYKDGIIIEDGDDFYGLKTGMEKIVKDRNFLKSLSNNALKKISNYSIEKYSERLIKFYEKVKKEKYA